MKRILILCLLIFITTGCKPKEKTEVTMIVPFGSPALSQLYMQESADYLVDIVQGSDPLVAAFGSRSHDVIFAPTNLGAKMYQAKPDYIMLGVIVWGNYYLVTEDLTIQNISDLNQKSVVIFGQNQTSDIIFKYIINHHGINVNITYVENVTQATETYLLDTSKIVLVAEPSLSRIMMLKPNSKTIDIQDEYKKIQGQDTYPQAGVFVRANLKKSVMNQIKEDLKNSIDLANENPSQAASLAITLGINLPHTVLTEAIPRSNLRFSTAKESKDLLEDYFNLLLLHQPLLIGNQLPNDAFYGG
jgi:NitT/TauT family transport system substrate-binding protein